MSSVVNKKCWLCPDTFGSTKDFKNHACSKHSAMRVVCPWCYDTENTYRTSAELLKHVDKRHNYVSNETKKGEFFSEKNGFWLATKPADYLHVVKPTEYDSTTAIQARQIVDRWLTKVTKKGRSRGQWEEGWNLAKSTQQDYSPLTPLIPEARLRLIDLELSSKGNVAYMLDEEATIGDVWYKADINSGVMVDKRAAESLLRRLQTVNCSRTIPCNFVSLAGDRQGIMRAAAKALGIPEKYITRIYRQIVSFSAVSRKRRLQCLADELGIDDDVEIIEPEPNASETNNKKQKKEKTSSSKSLHKQQKPKAAEKEKASSTKSTSPGKPKETSTEKLSPLESPPAKDLEDKEEGDKPTEPKVTITQKAVGKVTKEVTICLTPLITPCKNGQSLDNKESPDLDESSDTEENQETSQEVPEETPELQQEKEQSTCQEVPRLITAKNDQPLETTKTMQERASALLETGIMPLLPPARREWSDVIPIDLVSTGPTRITWPPVDWSQMNEEEKLTAWTYTAMVLEHRRGTEIISDVGSLLDRYSFLALPGTKLLLTDKDTKSNLRLLNYNVLRDIATGKMKDNEARPWIAIFESAANGADKSIDCILEKVKHVPFRLKPDEN